MTGRRQPSRSRGQARTRRGTNSHQALRQQITSNPGYAQQVEEAIETSRERADRLRSLEADREIEKLLGPVPTSPYDPFNLPRNLKDQVAELPEGYKRSILQAHREGVLSEPLARYYLDIHHADSDRVPGQGGRASLLKAILLMDPHMLRVSGWRAVRVLGGGGFGDVILWEKKRANGLHSLKMAVKDSKILDHWVDYNHEAHLTRRLIDRGCRNVINVVEWAYIPATEARNSDGTIEFQEQRHRTCYEYAEHADLGRLQDWYQIHGLIFPEAFLWHVFYSLANALCYCSRGGNDPRPDFAWDPIGHYDIKQDNIFLGIADQEQHRLYPCVKLGDFGCAWTVGPGVPEVRHYKSKTPAGTEDYVAPEVLNRAPEQEGRRRTSDELLGPQSDIFSVGRTFLHIHDKLLHSHIPRPTAYNDRMNERQYRIEAKKKAAVMIYSADLNRAVNYCVENRPKDRPEAYNLYQVTKEYMERWRAVAEVEAATAVRNGLPPQIFPSSVLYTTEDQERFENDPYFAQLYRQQNLARVWEIFPPTAAPQSNTYVPAISDDLGDDSRGIGRTPKREERKNRIDTQGRPKKNFGFAGVMKKIATAWTGGRR